VDGQAGRRNVHDIDDHNLDDNNDKHLFDHDDVRARCRGSSFVFWIGISHAGTLISAILRLVNAGWRRPVTRCAEVITAFALMIGGMFPIIHLGRPWLFFWLIPYPSSRLIWPNFRSPLVWDIFAIGTYLTGSVLRSLASSLYSCKADASCLRNRPTSVTIPIV